MQRNSARERRIFDEIIVDAHGPEEHSVGWYYYLERQLRFPFPARCRGARAVSPLQPGETVTATGMVPVAECMHEMFSKFSGRVASSPYL
jgi:hypothetical protein